MRESEKEIRAMTTLHRVFFTVKEFSDQLALNLIYNPYGNHCDNLFLDTKRADNSTAEDKTNNNSTDMMMSVLDVCEQHAFQKTDRVEGVEMPRKARLHCRFLGCKIRTSYECIHSICQRSVRKVNGKETQGVFYCTEHQLFHQRSVYQAFLDAAK